MGFSHPCSGERNLFGLAPGGVYLSTPITRGTGELLPRLFTLTLWNRRSRHSTGRYLFCGTFLIPYEVGIHFTRDSPHYGPPCPLELGLSSPPVFTLRIISGGATICSPSTSPLSFLLSNPSLDRLIRQTVCLFIFFPRDGFDLKGRKCLKILDDGSVEGP